MQHTLIALVENKPGVLNRVSSLFRRRNFNIDSLNVGQTETAEVSRMTIVVDSDSVDARKVEANLYKLVNVIDVQDVTGQPAVMRDLALIKVKANLDQRAEIANLASIFRTEDKIDSLTELLRPFGIIEMVRTGQVAMMRGNHAPVRHLPGAGSNGHHHEELIN
jgi:acetolactate synthase-1/3 small subunit